MPISLHIFLYQLTKQCASSTTTATQFWRNDCELVCVLQRRLPSRVWGDAYRREIYPSSILWQTSSLCLHKCQLLKYHSSRLLVGLDLLRQKRREHNNRTCSDRFIMHYVVNNTQQIFSSYFKKKKIVLRKKVLKTSKFVPVRILRRFFLTRIPGKNILTKNNFLA